MKTTMHTSANITEQRCAVCRQSLEAPDAASLALPILHWLRGLGGKAMRGELCSVCRYRVCRRCVDRVASARRGDIVCRRCAALPEQPPQPPQPEQSEETPR